MSEATYTSVKHFSARTHISLFATSLILVSAAGCSPSTAVPAQQDSTKEPSLQQHQLCEVNGWQRDVVASVCKPGQKVVFLPRSWGNAQLPVLFAAVNCDMRYSVAMTEGAVSCIYLPMQPTPASPTVDASQPVSKP